MIEIQEGTGLQEMLVGKTYPLSQTGMLKHLSKQIKAKSPIKKKPLIIKDISAY